MEINDGRKWTRSAQDAIRRKAVHAVLNGNMTQTKAAEVFGVTRTSVCLWLKTYRQGGEDALQSKRKGRPCGNKLTGSQEASIRKS
ncbi:MAG: helix-turn-helix domain-containing protein, partial [Deltaproteobacteria bacterium]|nr:helix-turn-helix domain-containing protein [Deltaproteobacteria bacterium]